MEKGLQELLTIGRVVIVLVRQPRTPSGDDEEMQ